MPVILALGRLKQKDHKFEATLGCIVRPCLKKEDSQLLNVKICTKYFWLVKGLCRRPSNDRIVIWKEQSPPTLNGKNLEDVVGKILDEIPP
jgi:hypothetical protein